MARADLKTELSRPETRVMRVSLLALALVLVLFHLVSIASAVIAQGQVMVQGKPRPVQSLEGGVLAEIRVRDGDVVAAGDLLVRLDPKIDGITRDILRGRLAGLLARQSRLEAERQQLETVPMPDLPAGLGGVDLNRYMAGQRDVFRTRRDVQAGELAQLRERIKRYRAELTGLEAQLHASQNQLGLIGQQVDNILRLEEKSLASESRLLDLQTRQAGLEGQIAEYRSDMAQTQTALRDTRLEILQLGQQFREGVVADLREVTAQIDETRLELVRIEETIRRLDIHAPVSGVVHELQVWTEGGVVPPSETLMTLIPLSDGVEFEVRVAPDAIDTVHLGQPARLRFPAFDRKTTPELTGAISRISPDSVLDPTTGRHFYRVVITLPPEELARLGQVDLIPGMPVEAFLETGSRSVLNILVKPLTDQLSYAFRDG